MATLDRDIADVRRFSRFYTQRLGLLTEGILGSDFSLTDARVLFELAHADDLTAGVISDSLGLDAGYLSRVVRRFERKGLLTRRRSNVDRRRYLLTLTAGGRAAFEQLNATSRAQVAELLADLRPVQRGEVVRAMRTIESALTQHPLPDRRVTYRSHRGGDIGWIVERHAALYQETHGWDDTFEALVAQVCADFLANYDPTAERSWIAEVDGSRAGAIALVRHTPTIAQLRLLFVEPWARGLGIGGRLVSECVSQARHFGYRRMRLFTVRGLDAARHLYEAEGFTLVEEKKAELWGRQEHEQKWELIL